MKNYVFNEYKYLIQAEGKGGGERGRRRIP